ASKEHCRTDGVPMRNSMGRRRMAVCSECIDPGISDNSTLGGRMRVKASVLVCVLSSLCAVAAMAQRGGSDPLTGTWVGNWGPTETDRNQVRVQLKWDGKALSGTVNPDGPNAVSLQKTIFDPKTMTVHMEAEAAGRGSRTYHYVIDGTVQNGTISGSWNHDR